MQTLKPERLCRACGTLVPHDAPFGHCPNCLVQLGFGALPEDSPPSSAGTGRFGEYELLEQIGRGGMGVVYKARQVSLKRLVALKMLGPHASAFPGIAERLRLEAEVAGSLRHPQIVTIYDVGEHQGQPFFTMELVEGTGLDKCIGADGFRPTTAGQLQTQGKRGDPEASIARITIQIARAVDHAHKHGVLHRDLKPANVVIDAHGEPHLTDFGLAKVLGRIATHVTASGAILGTPAYMAPEQASGATRHASTAADIYSIGAILYEMLTGCPPFRAETPLDTLRQVVEDPPRPPSTINRNVDRDLATICLKCLEKDPRHRYTSALAVAEELERWSRGEPIEARPMHSLKRLWCWCRREPVVASLVSGLFLLVTAVAVLGLILYLQERARLNQAQQDKLNQSKLLLTRIENEWLMEDRTDVRISAGELAMLADRPLDIDGTEVPVVLGIIATLRKPDVTVFQITPLVNYLQTRMAAATTPRLLFELKIYKSRSNALESLLEGKVDFMRVDPADYVLLRSQNTNIFPLVKQAYTGEPDLRAAIFTRTGTSIGSLNDLKGKSFAFGERDSALGDYLPKAALVKAGLRASDLQRTTNFHSARVVAGVRTNSFDAGVAEWDDVSNTIKLGARLTVLAELRCSNYPWLATKKLDARNAETITRRLLSRRASEAPVPFDPKLTGFESVRPSDYDALERDMETAKLFGEPR